MSAAGLNAFDALARHRTARGLPAQSLAWGLWESDGGMGGSTPRQHDGVLPLSAAAGMAALDRAMRTAEPVLVPVLRRGTPSRCCATCPATSRTATRYLSS
ncbi:hypothetical protein GCM10027200_40280 [Lentzea nigeriaca]